MKFHIMLMVCCSVAVCYSQELVVETSPPEGGRSIAEFEPCQSVLVIFFEMEPGENYPVPRAEFPVPIELIEKQIVRDVDGVGGGLILVSTEVFD